MLPPRAARTIATALMLCSIAGVAAGLAGCSNKSTSPFILRNITDGPFVSDFTSNTVPVYGGPFTSSNTPVFTMLLSDRIALTLDGSSGLITEQSNGPTTSITEFPYPLSVNPIPSASISVLSPGPITGYNGFLYFGLGSTISRTALPLTGTSTWTTFASGFGNLQGLSYNSFGLLVSDQGNGGSITPGVSILDTSGSTIVKITNGITNAGGVCGDGANSFFVVDPVAPKALLYTAPFMPSSTPSATITTGLSQPFNCKMNATDNIAIFVNHTSVTLYQPPYNAAAPFTTITSGLTGPSDALYASNIKYTF